MALAWLASLALGPRPLLAAHLSAPATQAGAGASVSVPSGTKANATLDGARIQPPTQPAASKLAPAQPATAKDRRTSNQLAGVGALIGTYFGMRHGESIPSSQQRVCSSMAAGIDPRNGLTERGREEVKRNSEAWLQANQAAITSALRSGQLLIFSSPFSRSRESAELLAATIETWWQTSPGNRFSGSSVSGNRVTSSRVASSTPVRRPPIRIEPDLRERDFGSFEGQSPSGPIYRRVWDQDILDPHGQPWGVESAAAVQRRATALIQRLERQSQGHPERIVVLVSHGDTLKILQTGFQQQTPSAHQDPARVEPFRTAEIRGFQLR